jgi:hypothetical protein
MNQLLIWALALLALLGAGAGFAQGARGRMPNRATRDAPPTWTLPEHFQHDVFTFVRIQYDSAGSARRGSNWDNDFPDCDWNFSARLHQLTSLQVDPRGKVIRLTNPELFDYPFIYMSNIGAMRLREDEVLALRRYLLSGGFLMADDFWAPASWRNVQAEMKRVFPDRKPRELNDDHPIFHLIFDLKGKPQVPSIFAWRDGHTFEYWHGDPQGDEAPHFWGLFDDRDQLMALLCHNNDIGDGWEREGEDQEYFRLYSERVSYPLGINIVMYAMTH